jgi:hypothetical protein
MEAIALLALILTIVAMTAVAQGGPKQEPQYKPREFWSIFGGHHE